MASEKTVVIDYLWDLLVAEGSGRRIVTLDDVRVAIGYCNTQLGTALSANNPANFMKDIVRGDDASQHWPARLTEMRIGARQRPGLGRVFEFTDFEEEQTEAFPNKYTARPDVPIVPIEALSLSLAKRSLGRRDESWLIQVSVELRLIQTHFATRSKLSMAEISHLQTGIKLGSAEVDCLFLGHVKESGGSYSKCLITCEAKQEGQRILADQLAEQVVAASRSVRNAGVDVISVVPFAIKAANPGRIYCAEFKIWSVDEIIKLGNEELPVPQLASEAVYELRPPVPGIGYRQKSDKNLP